VRHLDRTFEPATIDDAIAVARCAGCCQADVMFSREARVESTRPESTPAPRGALSDKVLRVLPRSSIRSFEEIPS
jgi:hypothetical protein